MGYGITPWGSAWGDPIAGYYLQAVSVQNMLTVGSASVVPSLGVGTIQASPSINVATITNNTYSEIAQ